MPAQRYRYIGDAPSVHIPDMLWGDPNDPELGVKPGDVSEPYEGWHSPFGEIVPVVSEVIVPVGSKEEQEWLKAHPEFAPVKEAKA